MTSDRGEVFKGAIHCVTLNLASVMCLYNALAWTQRRERRLAINATIYACLVAFESYHTYQHWRWGDAD